MTPVSPSYFDALYEQTDKMVKTLCEWIAIPSVANENATDGTPYGRACLRMLEKIEDDARALGLCACRNFDGHVLTVDLLENAPTALGIACHADVVGAGREGWRTDPWQATVQDGCIFGRGASDNKGAGVSALYALAFLKKQGLLHKNIRLYFGSDEENGSACLRYYQEHYERPEDMPPIIVPDAGNEIVHGEWGILRASLSASLSQGKGASLLSISAGEAMNIIPGRAEARLSGVSLSSVNEAIRQVGKEGLSAVEEGDTVLLTATGKSCHSSMPSQGFNAALLLLSALCRLPFSSETVAVLSTLYTLYTTPPSFIGQLLEKACLTFSLTGLFFKDGRLSTWHDSRYSYSVTARSIEEAIEGALGASALFASFQRIGAPHLIEKDHPFVMRLADIYEECQKEKATVTEMRAGTYASSLDLGVAYGQFEGGNIHGIDEYLPIDCLPKTAKLLAYTAYRMAEEQ